MCKDHCSGCILCSGIFPVEVCQLLLDSVSLPVFCIKELEGRSIDATTIESELKLAALVIEVGRVAGGVGSKPRHYLVVRNVETGEICLRWEEAETRSTDYDVASERAKLTRSLHDAEAQPTSSALSSPRSSVSRP